MISQNAVILPGVHVNDGAIIGANRKLEVIDMGDAKNKVFEDEFMDIQSEIISLCLDYVDKNADIIYAYCAIEERMQSFNACFRCGNELKRVEDFGKSRPESMKFLRDGSASLFDIREVCANYNMPVPTQIKMTYDVNTDEFNADYKYVKICTNISADEVYDEWVEELQFAVPNR